jgi:two-component system response regulator MprA
MEARRRPLLLLVEDDRRAGRTLARMLREDGYDVERAQDGAQAIGRLAHDPLPDVVLTDLLLPHVDGIAIARYARSRDASLPVVIMTGYPHRAEGASPAIMPPLVVLTKPFEYQALTSALAQATHVRGA